jgi:hypothetical protein
MASRSFFEVGLFWSWAEKNGGYSFNGQGIVFRPVIPANTLSGEGSIDSKVTLIKMKVMNTEIVFGSPNDEQRVTSDDWPFFKKAINNQQSRALTVIEKAKC